MNKIKKIILSFTFLAASVLTATGQQVVLQGDYPDPSVVKIGDSYWASATTSNWMPAFPLMQSPDLVNWTPKGYIFTKVPSWADYYFWAPEMTYENGKVYVYYTAHKKDGNLCVAVASAKKPEGPYRDHGPLVCQEVGSIDGFPMRDENGKLFLIWKEDANSVKQPTPIWAQEMNEDRTELIGEKHELFRNKIAWEENLVEGVSIIKQGDYFYAFYAAAGCCGAGCTYVVGIARAKQLLGPWEKDVNNPIMKNTPQWICQGHGTPIEKDGHYYFLHHAYDSKTHAFTGRQALLSEFTFTADNWVKFVSKPSAIPKPAPVVDDFNDKKLSFEWQWNVFQKVDYKIKGGQLRLEASDDPSGSFLGYKISRGNFTAKTTIVKKGTKADGGLAAIGDEKNTLTLYYSNDSVRLVALKEGNEVVLARAAVSANETVNLQMSATLGRYYTFSYSTDGGAYTTLNSTPVDAIFLPPWDRAVRVGLVAKGQNGKKVFFEKFELVNE